MPGSRPSRRSVALACALSATALLACASGATPPRGCTTTSECSVDARCISGACVANAPPALSLSAPSSPQANLLVTFDASASADADPGDSIAEFAWTFRAVSGQACAPPVTAGTGPVVTVRFACAGRYAVDVTAKDQLGATSSLTKELDVAAHSGAALVTAGPDAEVGHVCTSAPLCTTAAPIQLSASAPGFAPGEVAFAWTVEPPLDRPLSPTRRVTFTDPTAAAPGAAIETDGDAISGDWGFRVEARDAAGVIGTALVRVSVTNRPPVVVATVPTPDHQFDAVYSAFTVAGAVPYTASDPDGDPLVDATAAFHHVGDGASLFQGLVEDAPTRVTFSISVAYGVPADAAKLIGGDGLERTIAFSISDVNGGRALVTWPIVVGNRPPVLVTAPAPFTVDHTYDAGAQAYVADAPLSTWFDPDGDPLLQVPGSVTGDPHCPQLAVGETVHALFRWPFTGTLAVRDFALQHTVTQHIQDPWTAAAAPSAVTFTIGNRGPTIAAAPVDVPCIPGDCCRTSTEGGGCEAYRGTLEGRLTVGNVLPTRWSDPDGDPIQITVAAAGIYTPVPPPVCVGSACAVQIDAASTSYCGTYGPTPLPTSVTDGVGTATGTLSISGLCY